MKKPQKTLANSIVFQLRDSSPSKVIITGDYGVSETALIFNEEYNEVTIIQDMGGNIFTTHLDKNEIEALREILKTQ